MLLSFLNPIWNDIIYWGVIIMRFIDATATGLVEGWKWRILDKMPQPMNDDFFLITDNSYHVWRTLQTIVINLLTFIIIGFWAIPLWFACDRWYNGMLCSAEYDNFLHEQPIFHIGVTILWRYKTFDKDMNVTGHEWRKRNVSVDFERPPKWVDVSLIVVGFGVLLCK